jgi:hypothetical protein
VPAADARVKRLVEELRDSGYESVYLDRLRGRLDVDGSQAVLEQEIVQEMAAALGRTAAKVDLALLRLEMAARDLAAGGDAAAVARFNALREEALRARLELVIHREAIGFRRTDEIDRTYPIPARRR